MTTPTLPLEPSDELVAVAWIGSIPALIPLGGTAMVATTLPADVGPGNLPAPWVQTGFVTVAVVGGSPDAVLPVNRTVFQVDCWATKPGSNKPPWWQANAIASVIKRACWYRVQTPRLLAISASGVTYPSAVVKTATVLTAFRRMYADAADYAQYSGDVALTWTKVNDHIDA